MSGQTKRSNETTVVMVNFDGFVLPPAERTKRIMPAEVKSVGPSLKRICVIRPTVENFNVAASKLSLRTRRQKQIR